MCRYALKPDYKPHYACFSCRKAFKRRHKDEVDPRGEEHPAKCPQCGLLMADMGLDFKPPKASDDKAWDAANELFEVGETFHSCGCGGPGWRPRARKELAAFFDARLREYREHVARWTRAEPSRNRTSALTAWRKRIERLQVARGGLAG